MAHGGSFVRSVGGNVRSSVVIKTPDLRFEKIRREADGPWNWHFRQPELCLFWFHEPARQVLNAQVDGKHVTHEFFGGNQLCILPPGIEIVGEWKAGNKTSYTMIFMDPKIAADRLRSGITRPILAFEHTALLRSLSELSSEALRPDGMFDLLAEGWSIQALAYMSRISNGERRPPRRAYCGLSTRNVKDITAYIEAHLGGELTLQKLADQVGLSKRHFQRAFQNSFGLTPHGYVVERRIENAKRDLCLTKRSVTDLALSNGFCQLEHFTNTFRRRTGLTPTQYRARNR